jgi:hypothetical protein
MSDDAPRRVSLAVLPGTVNRLRMPLQTVACWRLGDGVFRFDHKLVGPEARPDFAEFWAIRDRHPAAPIALFGHADIKGDEDHNHGLGAERALAVYGVLNANPNLWYELFADDRAGLASLHGILREYGLPPGEEGFGPATFEAVARYMEDLGGGRRLEPYDYLDDGRHGLQSCSELNPVVRPSKELVDRLSKSDRARLEAVNRRVVAYFFEPGTYVGDGWPCPNAGAGIEGCYARLWSDAEQRRVTPKKPLQYWGPGFSGRPAEPFVGSQSTFACRFYDRIARGRGCEKVDPWRPPDPEPPMPPPMPPPPPIVDPPVEPTVTEWTLHLVCEHNDHTNRRWIYASGNDVLQVVPSGSDGDPLVMTTHPMTEVDWSLPGGKSTSGMAAQWTVPEVVAVDPKPWDLLGWKPEKYLVEATKGTREQMCTIEAYPHAQYSFDFERIREKLRDDLWKPAMNAWNIIGDFVADDFDLKFLEKGDFGGHLKMQWREHPGPDGGDPDYRAYPGYWFSLYADPLARFNVTMKVSMEKVLKYLNKVPVARKLLDYIPEKYMKRLEAASVGGSIEVEGGGRHDIRVDEPRPTLPSIGTDKPGASKVEIDGKLVWTGAGSIDLDALFGEGGVSLGSISVSLSAEAQVTMGLVLDVEDRRLGAYLEGDFGGVELAVAIELPAGIEGPDYKSDKLGAGPIDRISMELDF